jgi:NAD(P)-dependent dehydrogenase (short-subunit alcohol dehydrogenase family)
MTKISFDVTGKHVLISGGSGGIGAALGKAFRDSGAHPILCDLAEPPADCRDMRFERLDVTDDAAVTALAGRVERLDVLIHCAGRLIREKEFELETYRQIVDIHLFGAMRLATAFRPQLLAAKGSIINVGSMYSYFGAPHIPAYTSAKTGLVGLTRSLAVAWAKDGIRVNAIAPGWIRTEISRPGRENPEFNRKIMDRLPIGRWAEPEELAGTAIFLASSASALVTGVTIPVDGGYVAT